MALPDISYLDSARTEGELKTNFFGPILDEINTKSSGGGNNIIDNPDFSVNQYGLDATGVTATSNLYPIDRWMIGETLTTNGTVNLNADGNLVLLANSTETAQFVAIQKLEKYADYAGRTVTLTASVKTSASNVAIRVEDGVGSTTSSDHTGGGTFETLSVTHTFNASPTKGWVSIGFLDSEPITSGDEVEVEWVKLEIGDIATEFEPPSPAEEWAKCQRYYWTTDQIIAGYMIKDTNAVRQVRVFLPQRMASVPTVTPGPVTGGGSPVANGVDETGFNLSWNTSSATTTGYVTGCTADANL